jgi:polyphosphate kinase 2
MQRERYEAILSELKVELAKLEYWIRTSGQRIIVLFEGRDAAGKGGTINVLQAGLNPRTVRTVALPAPTERERTQWYFQRYAAQLPAAGEMVLFDRSWYNRAGVEPVMGFCTPDQHRQFLRDCPQFERMLTDDGIILRKYYLSISRQEQYRRFRSRAENVTKRWKLSPVDLAAIDRFDDYTDAKEQMFSATHSAENPWYVVDSNNKQKARIDLIAHLLGTLPYQGIEPAALAIPAMTVGHDRGRRKPKSDSGPAGPVTVGPGPR